MPAAYAANGLVTDFSYAHILGEHFGGGRCRT